MSEKVYSFEEMAKLVGMEPQPFREMIFEMGLIDQDGMPTPVALEHGLLIERLVPFDTG